MKQNSSYSESSAEDQGINELKESQNRCQKHFAARLYAAWLQMGSCQISAFQCIHLGGMLHERFINISFSLLTLFALCLLLFILEKWWVGDFD